MFILQYIALRLMDAAGSEAGAGAGSGSSAGSQGTSGQSGTPVSTPVSTPGTGSNAQTPPAGQQTVQQGQQQLDPNASDPAYGNWRVMRETLQSERTRAAGLETQLQVFTTMRTTAAGLAKTLGFDDADFQEAWQTDPAGTLHALREAQAEARRNGQQGQQGRQDNNLEDRLQQMVEKATKPANDFVNTQMTEAAMTKYNTTLQDCIKVDAVLKDAPPEVHELVSDYLGEYFASQPEILLAMKTKGDFSSVKEAVSYISGRLNGAFQKWLSAKNSTGGLNRGQQNQGQGQQGRPNGAAKITLDQIIEDPGVLGDQYR